MVWGVVVSGWRSLWNGGMMWGLARLPSTCSPVTTSPIGQVPNWESLSTSLLTSPSSCLTFANGGGSTRAPPPIVAAHHAEGRGLEELSERLTPELIGEHLYTGGQPDPDLVIRTSGEQRLSDFMLWQAAYSEFYFVEALGPDLRPVDFLRALRDYATRHRRFGG